MCCDKYVELSVEISVDICCSVEKYKVKYFYWF